MPLETLALAAVLSAAPIMPGVTYRMCDDSARRGGRAQAVAPLYPFGGVTDVPGPGSNGRLWISRPVIGGQARTQELGWRDPGPRGYGAAENDFSVVWVRVGNTAVTLSPWQTIGERGWAHLERARAEWLRENGYTGGVRTFVNDAFAAPATVVTVSGQSPEQPTPAPGTIEPRAKFRVPYDQPAFRSRMRVDGASVPFKVVTSTTPRIASTR